MNYKVSNNLQDFILNIKFYFNQKQNTTIYDKRNIIKIVEFEGEKYVVKSFKIPHFFNQIVYRFFRASKAKRSYANSIKLMALDINTPQPIGYIEFSTSLLFKKSFYISEFFNYDFEIRDVFSDKLFEDRENILKQFIVFSYQLHEKGVYHIDYSPGNILVKKSAESIEFSIIDVNRMNFVVFDIELRMKSLAKLTNNDEDNLFLVNYYAEVSGIDADILFYKLSYYLQKQSRYLKNKKKLKRLIS